MFMSWVTLYLRRSVFIRMLCGCLLGLLCTRLMMAL